jgi:hypothetical protein
MDCRVKPGNDTASGLGAAITDSVVEQFRYSRSKDGIASLAFASHHHPSRRDSSAPSQQARGQRLPFFLPLTKVRERSAGAARVTWGTFAKGAPPALVDRRALPALHVATFCDGTVQDGPAIQAALPRPFTRPHRPPKAAPSSGADDAVAHWDVATFTTPAVRHTLLRQPSVPRKTPSTSKADSADTRDLRECKSNFRAADRPWGGAAHRA